MKKFVSLILALALCLSLTACASKGTKELTKGISPQKITEQMTLRGAERTAIADFGVSVLKKAYTTDKNALISPFSILSALGMNANGADGETLRQMEEVFGMSVDTLNLYMHNFSETLPDDKNCKVKSANSVWVTNSEAFSVNKDFLQKAVDYYDSEVYETPFDDNAQKQIDLWVSDKTDKMINSLPLKLTEETIVALINALAFDAKWQSPYRDSSVRDKTFTSANGTTKTVDMMYSLETLYMEDSLATGFIKPYFGGSYAFAALLPNKGVSLEEYLSQMDGDKLINVVKNAKSFDVDAGLPKFESEYDLDLIPVLSSMGITDVFDAAKADLSGLGEYPANIFTYAVMHKTYVSVDPEGTKAAAVTVVADAPAADVPMRETKEVILDRPFLYMIIDTDLSLPIFIGVVNDIDA